ncbi:MAG TPA: hypothetical protein VG937_13105 [Polyangiaceae bacterium]|nr:hypothetical protein [Polyangiaceae bacterium]
MTRDPERILSVGGGADPLERALLESIHDVSPGAHDKDEAWARIAAQLGAGALAVGGTTAVASQAVGATAKTGLVAGISQSLATKLAAFAILAGSGAFVAARQLQPSSSAAVRSVTAGTASARAASPSERAPALAAPAASASEAAADVAPLGIAPSDADSTARGSALDATQPGRTAAQRAPRDDIARESALLAAARAELRRGDAKAAGATLARLRAEFPKGALGQEREVLSIEVLSAQGNAALAKRRAQSFVLSHPNSPHNAALSRFLASE